MTGLMETRPMSSPRHPPAGTTSINEDRFLLWIDGVGGFLLLTQPIVTIGGPNGCDADIQLLASLSRRHATLHRDAGGYLLEANGPSRVNDRLVVERVELTDGAQITLGDTVRLQFNRPTILSASARLTFQSNHRPTHSLDGVVLVDETCLLGPGHDCHVNCPEWTESVILVHRDSSWFVRSPRLPLCIDGVPIHGEATIDDGQVVTGEDLCFRLEPLPADQSATGGRR